MADDATKKAAATAAARDAADDEAIAKAEAEVVRLKQAKWDRQKAEAHAERGAGVYLSKGGATASITKPDGTVANLGNFPTYEQAQQAYAKAQAQLYPPPPPVKVDPAKHHVVEAVGLAGAKPKLKSPV